MDPVQVSDASSLLARVRLGDESALRPLWDLCSRQVYWIAFRIVKDHGEAEDIRQEVFLQLWQRPEGFDFQRGRFFSWMMIVTRNRAIDMLRRKRRNDSIEDSDLVIPGKFDKETEHELMFSHASRLLQRLPRQEQQLLEMAFLHRLTHKEIVERTGLPLGTVKTHIRMGLLRLRKGLEAHNSSSMRQSTRC